MMNNILKFKLEQLKNNQDKYLEDKEKAYKKREYSSGNNSDDALLDRQIAYREGYERGWYEALNEKDRLDRNFTLNETEAFKLMLDGSQTVDEYGSLYLLNREKNQIEITCKHNAIISYERFLEYQGLKFKIYSNERPEKIKFGRIISKFSKDYLEIKRKLLPEINNSLDKFAEKAVEENKTYKLELNIEDVV